MNEKSERERLDEARGPAPESVDHELEDEPGASPPDDVEDLASDNMEGEAETISSEELEELQDLQDRHLRLVAEFENYRKRTRKELLETRAWAQADLTGHLLEVLDDLGRVSSIPTDTTTVQALHEGVELVERKFTKALQDAGMEVIRAEGERFDPNLHEALTAIPTDDPDEDEIVAQVLVAGYKFGDRLLRPARVQVKKYVELDDE